MNAASSISTAPYPGLRPFKREEAELFFGRETQTNEMLTRLEEQPDFRFLAVIGASGSGKSSLVRAGLLPALEQGFLLEAPADWKFVTARPGDAPLRNLANAWVDTFHPQTAQPDAAESERYSFALAQLRAGPLGLVRAYRGEKATKDHAVLILIDQFEELFRFRREHDSARMVHQVPSATQSGQDEPLDETSRTETSPTTDNASTLEQQRNEAAAFVELLLATAQQTEVPMYVVITMRSDFLGDCDAFLGLPEAISRSQYPTPRMTRSQLEDAITRPLELPQFNARMELTLVTRILNDVGTDPDQLPLMQHALMRTWFEAQERSSSKNEDIVLTLDDYSKVGRFSDALSRHLDEAWNSLDKERQQPIAQQLFLCLSERTGEGVLIRRVVELGEVAAVANAEPDEVSKVVRVFQEDERNFIMASPSGELSAESVLDISHEALLRQWVRLRSWIEEEAKSAEEYIRLADSARRWQAGDDALLQGRALQRALEWKESRNPTAAWAKRYHRDFASALHFLNNSVAERERLEKQEEEQHQRELRRARNIVRVKITIGLVLVMFAVFASVMWIRAERATERAERATERAERATETATMEKRKALLGEKAALVKALLPKEPLKALVLGIQATGEGESPSNPHERLPRVESSLFSAIQGSAGSNLFKAHDARVTAVALSSDGTTIVSGSYDRTVRLWDRQGTPLGNPLRGHTREVTAVALSSDGTTIVSGSYDRTVRLWDRQGTPLGNPLRGHTREVTAVALSSDGTTIVSGSYDRTVRLWDRQGTPLGEPWWHEGAVVSLAISPEGNTIVSGSDDGTVRLWALESDTMWKPLAWNEKGEGGKTALISIAISPDGTTIVSGSDDGTVRLWDRQGTPLGDPLRGHTARVTAVALSPDGTTIVSGSYDRTVRLWDRQGTPLGNPLRGHTREVTAVALSSDGTTIVSGSRDGTVRLWNRQGTRLEEPWRHEGVVVSLAISPEGNTIVSGSDDGIVRLWNRQGSGKSSPKILRGHDKSVTSVAFSPDGEYIVSMSSNISIQLRNREGTPMGDPFKPSQGKTGGNKEAGSTGVTFTANAHIVTVSLNNMTVWQWPVGKAETWLPLACERVRNHDVLVDLDNPDNKIAKGLAEEVGPDIVRNAAEICLKSGGWQADKQAKFQERQRLASARVKVGQGRQLARQGDVAGALAAFQAAQQLDPAINLEPESTTPKTDPHAVAQHLVALTKVDEGRQLARQGDVAGALAAFQAAQQLDPAINLEPGSTTPKTDPHAVAQHLAALAKVKELFDQGRQLARQGNVEKAIQGYAEAEKLSPSLATDAAFWNSFAWLVSLCGDAAKGLEASEKAVRLTAKDDPSLPDYRDTRGLARALAGDTPGAIEDFQAFMDSDSSIEMKAQRQEWVNALRKGQQPFTPQLLEQLWSQ